MMMIPIYFYPSNYYLHYVFVLPLLIDYEDDEKKRFLWGVVGVVNLLVCVSEYWGFDDLGVDERYVQWSLGVLVGFLAIFTALAWDTLRAAWQNSQAKPEEERATG